MATLALVLAFSSQAAKHIAVPSVFGLSGAQVDAEGERPLLRTMWESVVSMVRNAIDVIMFDDDGLIELSPPKVNVQCTCNFFSNQIDLLINKQYF